MLSLSSTAVAYVSSDAIESPSSGVGSILPSLAPRAPVQEGLRWLGPAESLLFCRLNIVSIVTEPPNLCGEYRWGEGLRVGVVLAGRMW